MGMVDIDHVDFGFEQTFIANQSHKPLLPKMSTQNNLKSFKNLKSIDYISTYDKFAQTPKN